MLFDPTFVAIESAHRIRTLVAEAELHRLVTEARHSRRSARRKERGSAPVSECATPRPAPA